MAEMDYRGSFPSMAGYERAEELEANTREVVGDGTLALRVPGLKALTGVRTGTLELPICELRSYPKDPHLLRVVEQTEELLRHDRLPDGTQILRRSEVSNDGIWQKGVRFLVTGEWASGPAIVSAAAGGK